MRLSNILRFHTLDKANAPAFKPKQLYQLLNKFVTSIDTPLQKIIRRVYIRFVASLYLRP